MGSKANVSGEETGPDARKPLSILCCDLFCSSSCVPYIASFSGMSFVIASSVFCYIYKHACVF